VRAIRMKRSESERLSLLPVTSDRLQDESRQYEDNH